MMPVEHRSKLVRMRIVNLCCIGPDGLDIVMDDIVCLVGANNTGKSTVLRAYEAAVGMNKLSADEINASANGAPVTVELWVHIPEGAENIDPKWKEEINGLLLVRAKWEWRGANVEPLRSTWDPDAKEYAANGKAAGLDEVFNSRLPKPFRIGSLEDPQEEHRRLLALVLEPIKNRLIELMKDDESPIRARIKALQEEAERPVAQFREDLQKIEGRVNTSYRRVFSASQIRLSVSLGEMGIDPGKALVEASRIEVEEPHGQVAWHCQGTGSQRALFWSMLEVRSEMKRIDDQRKATEKLTRETNKKLGDLKKKLATLKQTSAIEKCNTEISTLEADLRRLQESGSGDVTPVSDTFLPGYMLLIDEPETALHPAAIRAAKEHLYSLASEAGWQVMLTTHNPAFVDPLKDHTTIVRLHRPEVHALPNVYRADDMGFSDDERRNLKSLLAFDSTVAEMFFGSRVVIVEGDTEFAAFTVVMDSDPAAFPIDGRPLLVRARGKWTIPILIKILAHFKVDFAVLHDVDSPKTTNGGRANGAYTANKAIVEAIIEARVAGIKVIHRLSCPNFELSHGMELPDKDKPYETWRSVSEDEEVRASVRSILDDLCAAPTVEAGNHPHDGKHYETRVKEWAALHAIEDPAFVFDEL